MPYEPAHNRSAQAGLDQAYVLIRDGSAAAGMEDLFQLALNHDPDHNLAYLTVERANDQ